MKRRLSLLLSLLMCLCLLFGIGLTAHAEDDLINYALDSSYWVRDPIPDQTVIGENGIVFDDYGDGQNYAGLSFHELLPVENTITITFTAEPGAGTFKIVFADLSKTIDGKALKSWERTTENIAFEIGAGSVTLWHYNMPGESNHTVGLAHANNKYLDGEEHTVTIKSVPGPDSFQVKITVDEYTHIDGTVHTGNFYNVKSVLTIGACATSLNSNSITVSSVTIKDDNPSLGDRAVAQQVAQMIDALPDEINDENYEDAKAQFDAAKRAYNNLTEAQKQYVENYSKLEETEENIRAYEEALFEEQINLEKSKWYIDSIDESRIKFAPNAVSFENFGGNIKAALTYKEKVKPDSTISFGYKYVEGIENSFNGFKVVLFDRSNITDGSNVKPWENQVKALRLSFDIDGNIWGILYNEKGDMLYSKGEWVSALIDGNQHSIQIITSPHWEEENCYISVKVYIDNTLKLNMSIEDMSLAGEYSITIGGATDSGMTDDKYVISNFTVKNNITSEPADLATQASLWEVGGGRITSDGLYAGKTAAMYNLKYDLPVEGTWSFDFRTDAKYNASNPYGTWTFFNITPNKFVDVSNWQNNLLDPTADRALKMTINDNAIQFHKLYYVEGGSENRSVEITKASTAPQNICDGYVHKFVYTTKLVEGGLKLTLTIDGALTLETVLDGTFATASCLRFSGRIANTANAFYLNNFKVEPTEDEVIAAGFMNAIYAIDQRIDADNVQSVKASVNEIKAEYEELTAAQKALIKNYYYITYLEGIIADVEQEIADKAAAKEVSDLIAQLPDTITGENVNAAKEALQAAQNAYDALTQAQKAYVANSGKLAEVQGKIAAYEKEVADKAAAKTVSDMIAELPEAITAENLQEAKDKVAAIKSAYDNLTADQKAYVEGYDKVAEIEEMIAEFEAQQQSGCNCSSSANMISAVAALILMCGALLLISKRKAQE